MFLFSARKQVSLSEEHTDQNNQCWDGYFGNVIG